MRLAAAASLVLLLAAAAALVASPIVSGSAQSCERCHSMRPFVSTTQASAHAGLACYECHAASRAEAFAAWPSALARMVSEERSGRGLSGAGSRVPDEACLRCHELVAGVREKDGLRYDHVACDARAVGCSACHATEPHRESTRGVTGFSMEECVECHTERGAPRECDTCHEGRVKGQRLHRGPWQVTHGVNWKTTHGAGDMGYCSTCHDSGYCTRCHGIEVPHAQDFGGRHGSAAIEDPAACERCHRQSAFCDACHRGVPMPHPSTFLAEHGRVATGYDDQRCEACHARTQCDDCHDRHVHAGATSGTLKDRTLPTVEPVQQ